jgi:hypothetical protein
MRLLHPETFRINALECKDEDFNNSINRLKSALEDGGKLEQTEIDLYNFTHLQIMEVRDEIKELNLEEKLDR